MEAVEKMDPDEEAARLAELLRDDFIDDLTSGGFMPVQLPMVDTGTDHDEMNSCLSQKTKWTA